VSRDLHVIQLAQLCLFSPRNGGVFLMNNGLQ
jgi:hypothetical protein